MVTLLTKSKVKEKGYHPLLVKVYVNELCKVKVCEVKIIGLLVIMQTVK